MPSVLVFHVASVPAVALAVALGDAPSMKTLRRLSLLAFRVVGMVVALDDDTRMSTIQKLSLLVVRICSEESVGGPGQRRMGVRA